MSKAAEEDLIRLLKFGTLRKIRDFLSRNPPMDLHRPTWSGSTPLTSAIERSDPVILGLLLDRSPGGCLDASETRPCGRTGLMHAAHRSADPEVLRTLMRRGADPCKTDAHGWNSLFYAVIGKRLRNVNLLLDCQVPLESRDGQGRTPLMISVYLSDYETFGQLVERGADVRARDASDLSVLQLAILRRRRDCVIELLRRRRPGDLDLPMPFAKVTTRRILRELMSGVVPLGAELLAEDEDSPRRDNGYRRRQE